MSDLENLKVALSNLVAALLTATTPPLAISYSIEGQSVSYGDYIRMLTEAIKALHELIVSFEPYELRSSAI